jgi:hypothetical protein
MSHHRRAGIALAGAAVGGVLWIGSFVSIDWWEEHLSAFVPLGFACVGVALGAAALTLAALGWRSPLSWLAFAIVASVAGLSIHELLTAEVS